MKKVIVIKRDIKAVIIFLILMAGNSSNLFSQVKIGDNPKSINKDAVVDIESINKGLLLPRISLNSTATSQPLSDFTSGMVVYNTSSKNDLTPGIYYSDGTKWIRANNNIPAAGFLSGVQNYIETVASNEQSTFKTPSTITDINKIFLYRNGVLISFTSTNNSSIISELPCKQGDQIRIIQLL